MAPSSPLRSLAATSLWLLALALIFVTGTITVGKSLTTASDAGAITEMLPKNV
jgi:hypothetical protein